MGRHVFLSLVMPVYNQEDHIVAVVDGFINLLNRYGFTYELILTPNGCQDNSLEICRTLSDKYPSVYTRPSPETGWGAAVIFGLKNADGAWLAFTNSARTSVDDLQSCLDIVISPGKLSVVKISRIIRRKVTRAIGSRLYNLEGRLLFGIRQHDINGTPKIFPRQFSELLALTQKGDLLDMEFAAICRRASYPVEEVEIVPGPRHGGESTTTLKSAWKMYSGAIKMWRGN